jgi:hypothetical protein
MGIQTGSNDDTNLHVPGDTGKLGIRIAVIGVETGHGWMDGAMSTQWI